MNICRRRAYIRGYKLAFSYKYKYRVTLSMVGQRILGANKADRLSIKCIRSRMRNTKCYLIRVCLTL